MKIIPLSEGSFTIDKTKVFVPFNKERDDMNLRPAGSLLVEVQPFVVVTENDIILLDTGLGFSSADGTMQIHEALLHNGIEPAAVTKVLLSHLHKDHAGGISHEDANGHTALNFPNAFYYVNKKEIEYATEKGYPSYVPEDFSFLKNADKLILLETDNGNVSPAIRYETSGGHCPYHTVYWITEKDEIAFFGGDVAPQLQQMKSRFVAKYDYDGKKCMELRTEWWQKGAAEHWTFLFYHDIKTPSIRR
jgi:glyoxylase-like metal-dependent hydrolase (beta-lactamase superfamily II)